MRRDPTSENSDLYEYKISLFGKIYLEEFLFFIPNFNITLETSGTLKAGEKIQYLHKLVRREALHYFVVFYDKVESDNPETLKSIIFGLGMHVFPFNGLSKQKCAMRCGMRKMRGLKLRC